MTRELLTKIVFETKVILDREYANWDTHPAEEQENRELSDQPAVVIHLPEMVIKMLTIHPTGRLGKSRRS